MYQRGEPDSHARAGIYSNSPKRTLRCPETKVIRHPEERQDWQYLHMESGKVLLNFPQIFNLCQASSYWTGFILVQDINSSEPPLSLSIND